MNVQSVSVWVGLVGGCLGILAAVGGGIAFVIAYFATWDQLRVVDCYQYFSGESLSAQTEQIRLVPVYRDLVEKAASAQVRQQVAPTDANLLAEYKEAVDAQDEAYRKLKAAQDQSQKALQEQQKCGHTGPEQLRRR